MLLVQIGEQAGKISEELKKKYEETDWQKIKGFRNRAVHDYTGLDRFVAFDIVKQYTPILIPAVSAIIREELAAGNFDKEEFFIATGSPYLKHVDFSNL